MSEKKVWIFQGKKDQIDLTAPQTLAPKQRDKWLATRYRQKMKPGDLVLFWSAGNEAERGIVGLGKVSAAPEAGTERSTPTVEVEYVGPLKAPVNVKRVRETPGLSDLLILRSPIGTNFEVTASEAETLADLVPELRQELSK